MCVMLTRISIAWHGKRWYDVVRSSYVVNIDCLTLDSNIQRTVRSKNSHYSSILHG